MIIGGILLTTVMISASDELTSSSASSLWSAIGSDEEQICREGMVYINEPDISYCIDRYPAAAGEDCPYPDPGSQSETRDNLQDADCRAVSEPERIPWRYLSLSQAQEACQSADKFLASGHQWYQAARGTPSSPPWGQDECLLDHNRSPAPAPAGSATGCVSHAGTYDQVGNVWEWVDEQVTDGQLNGTTLPKEGFITSVDSKGVVLDTDPDQPDENYGNDRLWLNPEGTRGVMRGGFYGSGTDGGVYSFHAEMTPDFAGRAVGFRCVTEPDR